MAVFSTFNNRLPDPTFGVNDAGAVDGTGYRGPGFAEVTIRSNIPVQVSRTNSGRGVQTSSGSHNWAIDINYHPMLREQFDPVASFLELRSRLKPFFVVLPQYSKPKDPAFASFVSSNQIVVDGTHPAGSPTLLIDASTNIVGTAKMGDYINIVDPANVAHMKAYKIGAVESNSTYHVDSTQPRPDQLRLHLIPPLTRSVSNGAIVKFINPEFRVVPTTDVVETSLNTDNLYSFRLTLEEIQP